MDWTFKDGLLAASIALNLLLGGLLGSRSDTKPSAGKKTDGASDVDHLLLQVQCGKGDKSACDEVDRRDREGCDTGDGQACVLMGIGKQVGKTTAKDEAGAAKLFDKACTLGDGSGCWYAGSCYSYGRGVDKDPARALDYYRKACAHNHDNGCLSLGESLEHASPPDLAGAAEAYDRGCALKYESACTAAKRVRAASGGH